MIEPSKYFKLSVRNDERRAITMALRQKGIYSQDLLYRAFAIDENCDKAARIEEILERGTDRTLDTREGDYNLTVEDFIVIGKRLKPSEYLWAAEESEIKEQLDDVEGSDILVSVYDNTKMIEVSDKYCFEFRDKNRPQEALMALIELEYKPVKGW